MPRVTTKGQVTIPKEIREALGIEPGDEVDFERVGSEYRLQKRARPPRTARTRSRSTAEVRIATKRCRTGCVDSAVSTPVRPMNHSRSTNLSTTRKLVTTRDHGRRHERVSRAALRRRVRRRQRGGSQTRVPRRSGGRHSGRICRTRGRRPLRLGRRPRSIPRGFQRQSGRSVSRGAICSGRSVPRIR